MSEKKDEQRSRRRPHSAPTAVPYLEVDLVRESEQLRREPEWKTGQNAKTLVKCADLRVVLIALTAHSRLAQHHTEARISIHTIQGRIQVRAEGRTFAWPGRTERPAARSAARPRGTRHPLPQRDG